MTTLADVIDAIEKNGLEKVQGEYIRYDASNTPVAGCAIGQAAINLDVGHYERFEQYDDAEFFLYEPSRLGERLHVSVDGFTDTVYRLNDTSELTLPEIAKRLRELYADDLNTEIRGL